MNHIYLNNSFLRIFCKIQINVKLFLKFIQDPDPESDPDLDTKLSAESDPDTVPKKIISDPQPCRTVPQDSY